MQGYRFVWEKRGALLRLGGAVVIFKTLAIVLIYALGLEEKFLRQGLLQLAPYFVEGWVVCYVIRWAVLGDNWFLTSRGDVKVHEDHQLRRSKDILASTIIYVLIKLIMSVVVGAAMMQGAPVETVDGNGHASDAMLISSFFLMLMAIWVFRFFWLYVPVCLGYTMREYLHKLGGIMSSIYMIAIWLFCFVPIALLTLFITQNMYSALGIDLKAKILDISLSQAGMLGFVHATADTYVSLVSGVAIALGVQKLMKRS